MSPEHHEQTVRLDIGSLVKSITVILLFLAVLFIFKSLLLVLLMSILIASAIEPATQWLMRRRIPRIFSVILIYLGVILCLVGIIFFLLVPLLSESSDFLRNFPAYFNITTVSNSLSQSDFLSSQPIVEGIKNTVNLESIIEQINTIIANISSNAFGTVTTVFGGILNFLLIFVLSFYLSVEKDGVGKFLRLVTPLRHERYVISLWERSQRKIALWMQGQLVLAVVIGMLVYLGLLILNVPNALLLATLAAALEIIPLFGPILASIPAIIIAFTTSGLPFALIVVGLYIIIHQFENQLIYPLVVKKVVGLSPVISILALVAGWELAGFFGLVLSVPVASVLTEYLDDLDRNKKREG